MCIAELVQMELMGAPHRQLSEKIWTRDKVPKAVRQFTNDDIGGFLIG